MYEHEYEYKYVYVYIHMYIILYIHGMRRVVFSVKYMHIRILVRTYV